MLHKILAALSIPLVVVITACGNSGTTTPLVNPNQSASQSVGDKTVCADLTRWLLASSGNQIASRPAVRRLAVELTKDGPKATDRILRAESADYVRVAPAFNAATLTTSVDALFSTCASLGLTTGSSTTSSP
jgi:hypothetical protein